MRWLDGIADSVVCAVLSHSVMSDSVTPWTVAPRLLCPWGFFRQEHWSGLPCPPPGALPNPGIKPRSPTLQVDPLLSEPPGKHLSKLGNSEGRGSLARCIPWGCKELDST